MTPREKVEEIVRDGMKRLAASQAGARPVVSASKEADRVTDAILTALASGSGDQLSKNPGELKPGDHAELARLAEAATPGPWKACGTIYEHMNCEVRGGEKGEGQAIAQVWDGPNAFKDGQFIAAANPATVLALIAENQALRGERDAAQSGVEAWAHVCESLEAHLQDRVAMQDVSNPERYLSILRSNIARVQKDSEQIRAARWADHRRSTDRATEAERKLAEARGWIEKLDCECDPSWSSRQCGRCTFISSTEAERG